MSDNDKLLELLTIHKDMNTKLYDACRKFRVPYLTQAYYNVIQVLDQLIIDTKAMIKEEKNKK